MDIDIPELPKNRRKGIILVADSTFLIASDSTKGRKDEQGHRHFHDDRVLFSGKDHHSHKYPVCHKAHSLRTISGVAPGNEIGSPAHESDQPFIFPFAEELLIRYPDLQFSSLILNRGYDVEEINRDIYEYAGITPGIIRKKDGLSPGFYWRRLLSLSMEICNETKDIEYKQCRTKYACFKVCTIFEQPLLFSCEYIKEHYNLVAAIIPALMRDIKIRTCGATQLDI